MPGSLLPILILKMGRTFPEVCPQLGDFDDWIRSGLSLPSSRVTSVDPSQEALPDPIGIGGVIISGSHSMVTAPSTCDLYAFRWLDLALQVGVPVFGICYGHQMICHVLGGEVGPLPHGPEIGVADVVWNESIGNDELFRGLYSPVQVAVTHYQSALKLPEGAVVLGATEREPHQAVRFRANVWGVQFHPEFSGLALAEYVERQATALEGQGQDPKALKEQAASWWESTGLLKRFGEYCSC